MEITNYVHPKKTKPADLDQTERQMIVGLINEDKVAEATRFSESLIVKYPQSFTLFYSLGLSYYLLDEYAKAERILKRAVKLNPPMTIARTYLGNCYLKLENHEAARTVFKEVLDIKPDDAEARRGLVQATVDLRHFHNSIASIEEQIEQDPENPNLRLILGQCYLEVEKYKRAIDVLTKANEVIPNDPQIMAVLGEANAGFHKPKEAISWFEKVLEAEGRRLPSILMSMSRAAKDAGDFDQSIAWAEEAIELNPKGAGPKNNLANILEIIGEKDRAVSLRQQAAEDDPENLSSIIGLIHAVKTEKADPAIKRLADLHSKDPETIFDEKQRISIGFALGKAYGDIGQYAKSIKALTDANARRRSFIEFDFNHEIKQFELMKHVFDPVSPDDAADTGNSDDPQMIFILGMPRSGTTLTEQIISTHSQVHEAGELNFMSEETAELMFMFGLQPDVQMQKVAFDSIRSNYLDHIRGLGVKEKIITDKMPHNFFRLGFVLNCFPEAKVIHLNRDPVAASLSCFQKFFPARGMGFTFDMADLGRYYGMYLDLMDYWREKFPGRLYELDYRALTEDQEGQTRALLEYSGLPWEDGVLDFHKTRRGVLTASQIQVREKMYRGSSDVWKKYRKHLGPLLEALDEAGVKYG